MATVWLVERIRKSQHHLYAHPMLPGSFLSTEHTHTHTHTHTHIYIYICVCMWLCVCVCVLCAPVVSFIMANIYIHFPESLWIAFLSAVIFHKHTWKLFHLPLLLTHTSPQLSLRLYRDTKKDCVSSVKVNTDHRSVASGFLLFFF